MQPSGHTGTSVVGMCSPLSVCQIAFQRRRDDAAEAVADDDGLGRRIQTKIFLTRLCQGRPFQSGQRNTCMSQNGLAQQGLWCGMAVRFEDAMARAESPSQTVNKNQQSCCN